MGVLVALAVGTGVGDAARTVAVGSVISVETVVVSAVGVATVVAIGLDGVGEAGSVIAKGIDGTTAAVVDVAVAIGTGDG